MHATLPIETSPPPAMESCARSTPGEETATDHYRRALGRLVRRHSTAWLVAGSVIGVGLALLLVWPELARGLGPFTYGRWMPLHLGWQLYGWCALPLVGALLAAFVRMDAVGLRHARVALAAWSLALGLGGIAWLGGHVSGKLFLDWSGWTRPLLPLAMSVLWTVLAAHAWWRRREWVTPLARWSRWGALGVLLPVPGLFYWAADRHVFPAVNPHSGGATGASLLGSTLGIVVIFALLPVMLGVRRKSLPLVSWRAGAVGVDRGEVPSGAADRRWTAVRRAETWRQRGFLAALAASFGVFALLDHGHASHHAAGQIAGLGVLLAWVPLLVWRISGYAWPAAARPWLAAAAGWWAVLVASGWVTFLPGVSERWKFTHALVAHAHLAMAGLVTSVLVAVLGVLDGRAVPWWARWAWQGGSGMHVILLLVLGTVEQASAAEMFYGALWIDGIFWGRLLAGLTMLAGAAGIAWGGRVMPGKRGNA